jgi:hypothetical protein
LLVLALKHITFHEIHQVHESIDFFRFKP